MRIRVPNLIGGLLCPKVFCYSIRSFKVHVTHFFGRTTTKIITFFQESFPNLETLKQLSGRPRGIWCYTEPPPRKRASFGDASLAQLAGKALKKTQRVECSWEFHPAPRSWGPLGSRKKSDPIFFFAQGRFGCWRSSILTHFFGGGFTV